MTPYGIFSYVHTREYCAMCGNFWINVAVPQGNGATVWMPDPDVYCPYCCEVRDDYGNIYDYEEFDEDDEYYRTHTCEICGGEYGDGWSTCTCEEE